uniref:CAP-Gly domain-containing protein n=1 Tax=Opuntia streptacantha TaxID=393608 RepID=A0A7C9E938_OPUST
MLKIRTIVRLKCCSRRLKSESSNSVWLELRLCCSAEYLEFQFCGEMGDESESTFAIGQRVHSVGDSRRIGTVKYVGPIQGYSGDWVGVDWDNGDGRNDGSVNGVRYFQAKTDNSASFVRPKNLVLGLLC